MSVSKEMKEEEGKNQKQHFFINVIHFHFFSRSFLLVPKKINPKIKLNKIKEKSFVRNKSKGQKRVKKCSVW